MTTPSADLENSIRLALEAAEAANDTAEEVARLSSDTQAAAQRLDSFAKTMKPIVVGTLIGAVVSVAIGGLVYFRTLSDMRTTSATQIEALTLFSKSVTDLQAQVDIVKTMADQIAELPTAQDLRIAQLENKLADMENRLAEKIEAEANTLSGGMADDGSTAQMLRSVADAVKEGHQETQNAFVSGLSDLQLAMTRMLADTLGQAAAPDAAKAQAPAKPAPRKSTTKASATRPPARAPQNPFKYP